MALFYSLLVFINFFHTFRATSAYYAITGILEGLGPASGQVPLRQEVDAWFGDPRNGDQVSLFLLALSKFQAMPMANMKSYFQIAGIHGLPSVPWDEESSTQTPGTLYGYCAHNSIIFPAWHRPYVLLYEQRLYEIMMDEVIPSFPEQERGRLIAAARVWRLSYWDWAAKKSRNTWQPAGYRMPLIAENRTISVLTPDGRAMIPNPMYVFTTPQPMGVYGIVPVNGIQYDICKATSRCPPADCQTEWINGTQNNNQVNANLNAADWCEDSPEKTYMDTLGEAVYRLFSENYFTNYDAFASARHTEDQPPPDYLSVESLHNNIHSWVGGKYGGHMGEIPVAAFDPIFWLHHANVDRQFAIWQTLNPTSWFNCSDEQLSYNDGNWYIKPGSIDTPQTPLAPFRADINGTYFTSDSVRNWTALGYTYPELQPWQQKNHVHGLFSEVAYRRHIVSHVNSLYSSTRTLILDSLHPRDQVAENRTTAPRVIEHFDYVVNILYDRFALGSSPFTIHVSIGGDATVGSVYNFGGLDGCQKCGPRNTFPTFATAQIPITNVLLRHIEDNATELQSLHPRNVGEYLRERLSWTVTKTGGASVPIESMPSLQVSVSVGRGIHYKDDTKLSKYQNYQILYTITTEGRLGGLWRNHSMDAGK